MAGIQKLLRIFAFISVESFYTGRGVTHNNYPVCDVYEILNVYPNGVPSTPMVEQYSGDTVSWCEAHLARGPASHP